MRVRSHAGDSTSFVQTLDYIDKFTSDELEAVNDVRYSEQGGSKDIVEKEEGTRRKDSNSFSLDR
jgi:hypothetical protein